MLEFVWRSAAMVARARGFSRLNVCLHVERERNAFCLFRSFAHARARSHNQIERKKAAINIKYLTAKQDKRTTIVYLYNITKKLRW